MIELFSSEYGWTLDQFMQQTYKEMQWRSKQMNVRIKRGYSRENILHGFEGFDDDPVFTKRKSIDTLPKEQQEAIRRHGAFCTAKGDLRKV